jgi:hypothetical protein
MPEIMADHQVNEPVDHKHNTHARQRNGYEYAGKPELLKEIQVKHHNTQPTKIYACCSARKHFKAVDVFLVVDVSNPTDEHPREVQE